MSDEIDITQNILKLYNHHNITEILLKVALNTINQPTILSSQSE
jgi:hypothetical protein